MNEKLYTKPTAARSANMRAIKSTNTKPELVVGAILKKYRFKTVAQADLPGRPDFLLIRKAVVIRVMGCFWHGHHCKRGRLLPKTNSIFWCHKISGNKKRDKRSKRELHNLGFQVLDVWQCKMKYPNFETVLLHQIRSIQAA